jgi:transketolase
VYIKVIVKGEGRIGDTIEVLDVSKKSALYLSHMGSRGAFGQAVYDWCLSGKPFYAVSSDYSVPSGLSRVIGTAPGKYVDVGISEQNMIGVAAGLADEETPVVATSWGIFSSYRCADQVRVLMGMMQSNIKLVGLTSGISEPRLGGSHFCVGDIALLRGIPNLIVIAPSDGLEIYQSVICSLRNKGPVYIRLTGGDRLPILNEWDSYQFEIGKANWLKKGEDILFISCGVIIEQCKSAIDILEKQGFTCSLLNMHTIKPLDINAALEGQKYRIVVTVEEHNTIGGLGSAVSELYSSRGINVPVIKMGISDFVPKAGKYDYLLKQCSMDSKSIVNKICECMG